MKRIYIGLVCLVLGIGLVAFPFIREGVANYRQQQLLMQWQRALLELDNGDMEEDLAASGDTTTGEALPEDVVGILEIPAIELRQPILKGATKDHLAVSVSTVEPTEEPGTQGNFAVAGHNSRTYGRHFNRLAELKEGDLITVWVPEGSCQYQVVTSYVVEADELWVLESTLAKGEITLITCYYPEQGETQRLIVKGRLKG